MKPGIQEPPSSGTTLLERKLRGAWRRERRFFHGRGLCHFLVAAVGLVVLDLAADWSFSLPGPLRILLGLGNLTVLVWVFLRYWWCHLRPFNSSRVALQVEKSHNGLQSLLISHVQLKSGSPDLAGASPRLVEAMRQQAVETASPLDFGRVVSFRSLRKLAIFTLAALALFTATVLLATDFYRVLLLRMLDPASDATYPTRTDIVEVTGPVTVQQGQPVLLRARVTGQLPPQGHIHVRYEGSPWEKISLKPEAEAEQKAGAPRSSTFEYALQQGSRSFIYYFRLGDDASLQYPVTVVPSPKIVETRVRLKYPAYTGKPAAEIDRLNLEVLEGTEILWELRCDRPLKGAELMGEGAGRSAMLLDSADARLLRWTLRATTSFAYRFAWVEKTRGFRYEGNVRYSVRVIPDRPPRVEILDPRQDEKGTVKKQLEITFRASDDYGRGDAWIVYSLNEGPEVKQLIGSLRDQPDESMTTRWKLAGTIPDLKEKDIIQYAIEVSDNRESEAGPAPSRGRSHSLQIEILGLSDYLKYMAERKAQLFGDIKGVFHEETEGSRNVKTLKGESQ